MNDAATAETERAAPRTLEERPVERVAIDTIRTLAMDAVQSAGSGHPGTAMALAPVAYCLWMRHMRYSPEDPEWFDRDRFVLSAGHAAILQYSLLHLTGYDLPLEQLQNFRRAGSITPGHPEKHLTPGIETTTGPLGQGVLNSVGLAIAEAHLAETFNRPGHRIVDHHTYVICSDGDLMEVASYEAASLAGHLGLGKLIWIYDDNRITIDGSTDLAFSDDVQARFEALGWHVIDIGEASNDLEAVDAALAAARAETGRPSLIKVRTHIAFGAPNKQDTPEAHGEPLGEDEVRLTKRAYGWPEDATFLVPERVREHMRTRVERGRDLVAEWKERFEGYRAAHPELAAELERRLAGRLPDGWDSDVPGFGPDDGPLATRAASGKVLQATASRVPELIGGSADLSGSNKTLLEGSPNFSIDAREGRNLRWGVREHVMCGSCNGIALHGAVRPYAATFLIFTDYARPSIRLAALMGLPVIYVLTHDSIGLGGDGPTHQPVEHLASFRAMPGMRVIRPADANEVATAWRMALERGDGPTMIVLTRQKVPIFDRAELADADGVRRGAYVLGRERGSTPDTILIASGSEVQFALEARERLRERDVDARVVSFPCWEVFRAQPRHYRDSVLPAEVGARVVIEAAAPLGWREWLGPEGVMIGVERFGQSGSYEDNYRDYGLTAEHVVRRALDLLGRGD